MDETRFDALTRLFSDATRGRRSIIGAALGLALAPLLEAGTAAKKKRKQRRRDRDRERDRKRQVQGEGKKKKCKQAKKCAGRVCGNFGCKGSSCGSCPSGRTCTSQGQCVTACVPNCAGKQCGSNGCGGSCGTCAAGSSCTGAGTCQVGCTPQCAGKTCGPNGCGGSCGTCPSGQTCSGSGTCQATCTPNCTGKNCGGNGCGGSCGTCPAGQTCSNPANGGTCQATCTPNCAGKNCGSNGCGGSCGTCSGGLTCSNPGGGGVCQCAGGGTNIGTDCWPDSEESAFLTLLNNYRANNGKPQLTSQNQLVAAAELHSQYQASVGVGGHGGPGGNSAEDRIEQQGYAWSAWAENVYWGSGSLGTAQSAFDWWKNSPDHNANMLSTAVTQVGIGRAFRSANGFWYWTTVFGKPA